MNQKLLHGACAALYVVTSIIAILFAVTGILMAAGGSTIGIALTAIGVIGAGFSIWQLIKYIKALAKA